MKVLIAEDNVALSHSYQGLLRSWGYEPVVVHDGHGALAALRASEGPRLAVLDWLMPGMDGIQVCREAREDATGPYTYLVLLTGQGGRQEMLQGLEAGADDFLVKPVDPAELKARLNTGRRIVRLQEQLLATQQLLRQQATRDALTGLWNRRMILDILERELARSRREGQPVGVIMADLDHFKHINDTHGHLAGDQVLREAAQRLLAVLRPYDTVGRYGGEEFLIVLPGCDAETTLGLAERLRRCVASEAISLDGGKVPITLSLGVAAGAGPTAEAVELLPTADAALYQAKHAGRNTVRVGSPGCRTPPALQDG